MNGKADLLIHRKTMKSDTSRYYKKALSDLISIRRSIYMYAIAADGRQLSLHLSRLLLKFPLSRSLQDHQTSTHRECMVPPEALRFKTHRVRR